MQHCERSARASSLPRSLVSLTHSAVALPSPLACVLPLDSWRSYNPEPDILYFEIQGLQSSSSDSTAAQDAGDADADAAETRPYARGREAAYSWMPRTKAQ